MSPVPELEDIQGIIVRGYGRLKGAYFVLLRIETLRPPSAGWASSTCAAARPNRASRTPA